MIRLSRMLLPLAGTLALLCASALQADDRTELRRAIDQDYRAHLESLFVHFHRNPELSGMEVQTAARLARELREAGLEVTEGVGGTGLVALLRNGDGPVVMMRADMDGLPVREDSGLDYASRATQVNTEGEEVPVMHACGHDVHITSLVGTARQMMALRDQWSGTLMLIAQPAEETISGARAMMQDDLWQRFGQPDYALAFHVAAQLPAGQLSVTEESPYSGSDTVDIIVHGVGAHGASPHEGVDPVVLASQIVLGLQTVISREKAPRDAGVITVGSFHAGSKHNIIPDRAHLQLTVRNDDMAVREQLLAGIRRVAENMGRAAGMPEDRLPEVIVSTTSSVPPTVNDAPLSRELRGVWEGHFGPEVFMDGKRKGMGAEDFSWFTTDPYIPSTYFAVGGTPLETMRAAMEGGPPVPSHHSPQFRVAAEPAVTLGVEATIVALLHLLQAERTAE